MDLENLQKIFSIIVLNIVLSGDNAVVIGMAARTLDARNRRSAIIWGSVGAVGLRIFFTILAALLLDVPLLQAIGGVLLILLGIRMITPASGNGEPGIRNADSLGIAIRTIILADVVMSLDNILAVGGTAKGRLGLLLFGLGLSIPLILVGSTLIAKLLQTLPWLLILGVVVLIHAAVEMFMHDKYVEDLVHFTASELQVIAISLMMAVLVIGVVKITRGGVAGIDEAGAH